MGYQHHELKLSLKASKDCPLPKEATAAWLIRALQVAAGRFSILKLSGQVTDFNASPESTLSGTRVA